MTKAKKVGEGTTVQLATRIPKTLHREAMLRAITEERPLQDFMAEALAEHLERCQQKQARAKDG